MSVLAWKHVLTAISKSADISKVICCVSWNHSLLFSFWHLVNSIKWPYYPITLWETKLDDSIDSGNFFVRGYVDLIQKDFVTHMNGLPLYVKKGYPFAKDLSLETSANSYLWLGLLTQYLTSFSSVITFFVFIHSF